MNYLTKIREKAKLNRAELADRSGVSYSSLRYLETGKVMPHLRQAYKIAAILEKTVYEIWPDETEIIEATITIKKVKEAR